MRAWSGAQFDNSTFKLSESGDADVRRPAVKRREKIGIETNWDL